MNQRPHINHVAAALIGVLGLSAAIGQTNATRTATSSDATDQAISLTEPVVTDETRPERARILNTLVGQTHGMDGPSPLSRALIVLTNEASQARLQSLTEDLNIMCRIFDRMLAQTSVRSAERDVFTQFLIREQERTWPDRLFQSIPSSTQCLHIEGHGPLFIVSVDFPLVEARSSHAADEPNAPLDPLWAQVSEQLYAPPGSRRAEPGAAAPAYSPEKLRSLRQTLTRALKHAANIRQLGPDERVTVLVRTTQGGRSVTHTGFATNVAQPGRSSALATTFTSPARTSLLALAATIRDIREYAAGALELAEFEKRIESAQYE
jgi:hypothetical protein